MLLDVVLLLAVVLFVAMAAVMVLLLVIVPTLEFADSNRKCLAMSTSSVIDAGPTSSRPRPADHPSGRPTPQRPTKTYAPELALAPP